MLIKFPVPPTRKRTGNPFDSAASFDPTTAFESCHERYHDCLEYRDTQSSSSLQEAVENYILDFELAARKSLGADSERFDLFRMLFLESRSTTECCGLLEMDRFTFTSESLAVKAAVGAALVQREMFPLDRYFGGSMRPGPFAPPAFERLAA